MFDLEKQISEWRKQMLAAGIKAPVPLDELEIHLREEVEKQICSELSSQQAFEAAIHSIGQANMLNAEFQKAGGIRNCDAKSILPTLFAFLSLALFIAALFVPLLFGVGYLCVVTASVWEISHPAAVLCALIISAIVLIPVFRPNTKSWLLPLFFGLIVFALTICSAIYTFAIADKFHTNFYFDPYDSIVLAIGALLCVGEGFALKPRRRSVLA